VANLHEAVVGGNKINMTNAINKSNLTISASGMGGIVSQSTLYSFHPGGINVALCDGSVRFLSNTVSTTSVMALLTIADFDQPLNDF
jgi:prepilin-type processing-associated H-X9-DG protein